MNSKTPALNQKLNRASRRKLSKNNSAKTTGAKQPILNSRNVSLGLLATAGLMTVGMTCAAASTPRTQTFTNQEVALFVEAINNGAVAVAGDVFRLDAENNSNRRFNFLANQRIILNNRNDLTIKSINYTPEINGGLLGDVAIMVRQAEETFDAPFLSIVNSTNVVIEDIGFGEFNSGALFIDDSDVFLDNVVFYENTAVTGGAIVVTGGSNLDIYNSIFENNDSLTDGGAIWVEDSNLNVHNSIFGGNDSFDNGGAIWADNSSLNFSDSIFIGNESANGYGGAIYALDSTVVIESNEPFNFMGPAPLDAEVDYWPDGSGFLFNIAADKGGAIYANNTTLHIFGTVFGSNSSEYLGGAIFATGSDLTIGASTIGEDIGEDTFGSYFLGNSTTYEITYGFEGDTAGGAIFMAPLLIESQSVPGEDELGNVTSTVNWSVDLGSLDISNTRFENNSSDGDGGAIALRGTDATLFQRDFIDNNSGNNGGAIDFNDFNYNSEIITTLDEYDQQIGEPDFTFSQVFSTLDIRSSEFLSNSASDEGGAIYVEESDVYIKDSTFGRAPSMGEDNLVVHYGNYAGDEGGAIYINESYVEILNSEFYSNKAYDEGGALYIKASTVYITDSRFGSPDEFSAVDNYGNYVLLDSGNYAGDEGGAISVRSDYDYSEGVFVESKLTIVDSEFYSNEADDEGGAIYIIGSTVDITGSIFERNDSDDDEGGAIYIKGSYDDVEYTYLFDSVLTITDSTFFENEAEEFGGAIYAKYSQLDIEDSEFRFNDAEDEDGGAIHARESRVSVYSSLFENNEAGTAGGAISIVDGALYVTDSVFIDNVADHRGGAIDAEFNYGGDDHVVSVYQSIFTGNYVPREVYGVVAGQGPRGGAINVEFNGEDNTGTVVEIWGSIFEDNIAFDGAAVAVENVDYVEIFGSIFDDNDAFQQGEDFIVYPGSSSAVRLNNVDEVFLHFSDFNNGGSLTLGNVDISNIVNSTFTANSGGSAIIQIVNDEGDLVDILDEYYADRGLHALSYNTFVNNLYPSIEVHGYVDILLLANVFADEEHNWNHVYFNGPGEDGNAGVVVLEYASNFTTAAQSSYADPVTWDELELEPEVGTRNNVTAGFGEFELPLELTGWRPSSTSVLANVVPSFDLGELVQDGFPILPSFDFFGASRDNALGESGFETAGALRALAGTPPNPGGGGGFVAPLPPLSHIVIPPAAAASQTLFLLNGVNMSGTTSVVNGAIRLAWDSYQVNITPTLAPGSLSGIASDGVLEYVVGDGTTATVSGSGLLPMSTVHVYILSTPTLLGTFTTDAEGKFTGSLVLPSTMASGKHYLQVNGYSKQSTIASGSVAVRVQRIVEGKASSQPITFRVNSSRLSTKNKDLIKKLVQEIRSVSGFVQKSKIVVNGSASPEGIARLNSRLAKARANAVVAYLKELGISADIVEVTQEDKRSRSAQIQVIYKNKA
jgi:predicted outer membrane repeat protein